MKSSLKSKLKDFLFGNGKEEHLQIAAAVAHGKKVASELVSSGMTQDEVMEWAPTVVGLLVSGGPEGGQLVAGKVLAMHKAGLSPLI